MIYAEEMQHTKQSLIESVAASSIQELQEDTTDTRSAETFRHLRSSEEESYIPSQHSLADLVQEGQKNIDLSIEITPYENRVVIPRIGKNIPLIEVKQKKVEGPEELNDIFMKELEE